MSSIRRRPRPSPFLMITIKAMAFSSLIPGSISGIRSTHSHQVTLGISTKIPAGIPFRKCLPVFVTVCDSERIRPHQLLCITVFFIFSMLPEMPLSRILHPSMRRYRLPDGKPSYSPSLPGTLLRNGNAGTQRIRSKPRSSCPCSFPPP